MHEGTITAGVAYSLRTLFSKALIAFAVTACNSTTGYRGNHVISKALAQNGLTPKFAIEVNDMPTVIDLVKTGKWCSIVVGTGAIEKGLVSILSDDKSLVRMGNIISLKKAYETRTVKSFKQLLSGL